MRIEFSDRDRAGDLSDSDYSDVDKYSEFLKPNRSGQTQGIHDNQFNSFDQLSEIKFKDFNRIVSSKTDDQLVLFLIGWKPIIANGKSLVHNLTLYVDDPFITLYKVYRDYGSLSEQDKLSVNAKISPVLTSTMRRIEPFLNFAQYIELVEILKKYGAISPYWNGKYDNPRTYAVLKREIQENPIFALKKHEDFLLDNPNIFEKLLSDGYFTYDNKSLTKPLVIKRVGHLLMKFRPEIRYELIQRWKTTEMYTSTYIDIINVKRLNLLNNDIEVEFIGDMDPSIYLMKFHTKYQQQVERNMDGWSAIEAFENLIKPDIHRYLTDIKYCMDTIKYNKLVNALFQRNVIESEQYMVLPDNLPAEALNQIIQTVYETEKEHVVEYLVTNPTKFQLIYGITSIDIIIDVLKRMHEQYAIMILMSNNRPLVDHRLGAFYYLIHVSKDTLFDIDLGLLPEDRNEKHMLLQRIQKYVSNDTYYRLVSLMGMC